MIHTKTFNCDDLAKSSNFLSNEFGTWMSGI